VRIAVDVFTAIRFLHVGNQDISKCFHRDVKSANIVLKRDLTAQLVDCGIAKFVQDNRDSSSTFGFRGTPAYSCPLYSLNAIVYDESCDIYSFGVVLMELWTGMLQNSKDETGKIRNFRTTYVLGKRGIKGDIANDVDRAMVCDVGAQPLDSMLPFARLALSCMDEEADERPSGERVLDELQSILVACSSKSTDQEQF
jgi:serine/threonine protein kinase